MTNLKSIEEYFRPFTAQYHRLFSIREIETETTVQWMFGAMLFYFFVSFSIWMGEKNITVEAAQNGSAICWPFFQNCTHFYFLHAFPYGYSYTALYMFFYGVMCLIVYCMWQKKWVYAHILLLLLLLWKIFVMLLSFNIVGPYDYYHIILTSVLLFVPYKEYFLKLSFVVMYFMSVTVKFTPAWELGTYFTSMRSGLPLFPSWSTVFLTNFVIFIQVIDCWFLMSKNWILQRGSFFLAAAFHLFSGLLVFYNYPSIALPPILILFGPMYRYTSAPFGRKAIAGWMVILLIALFQLLGFVISPDRFLTLEGHRYGMFMFEANHQCTFTINTYSKGTAPPESWSGLNCKSLVCMTSSVSTSKNGETVRTMTFESASSWYRCDPYETWFLAKPDCNAPGVERVSLQFDHSINGGPFYRIVDEPNICNLTYNAFSHNSWIKVPPEAKAVGYPVQNYYSL